MPADFEKCVKQGGRVRTVKPNKGSYLHVCYDKKGESHSGEVMHNQGNWEGKVIGQIPDPYAEV